MKDYSWVQEFFNGNFKGLKEENILKGYYNHNYIVDNSNHKYILRIPILNAENMDPKCIPESKVLKFLEQNRFKAPRLLYEEPEKKFCIHSFIDGLLFNEKYPGNIGFPDWIAIDLANQTQNIHNLATNDFLKHCSWFKLSPKTDEFFIQYLKFIEEIYKKLLPIHEKYFKILKIPEDPFKYIRELGKKLTPRDFVFAHCDIHRKNLIINENQQELTILDWELVLITDPYYDIAVHFHKMRYTHAQEKMFLQTYLNSNVGSQAFENAWDQILIYLKLERIKSAIIDFSRYFNDLHNKEMNDEDKDKLVAHYLIKLNKAYDVWNVQPLISLEKLENIFYFIN